MKIQKKTCCATNKSDKFQTNLLFKYIMENLSSQILDEIEQFKNELKSI